MDQDLGPRQRPKTHRNRWKAGLLLGSIAGGSAVAGFALAIVAAAPRLHLQGDETGFD